jgi:uncharacterized surface protein with fasciclin (FAS1) repeats
MKLIHKGRGLALAVAATLVGATIVTMPQAQADAGTNSLASVLTAKSSFDTDPTNYDILTAAVLAVLKAKPDSPVKVLTDGTAALTAFIPNDGAFENLVTEITGKAPATEQDAFNTVASLGIDTVEQILEYHVVPGSAILSGDALKANGAVLNTALPGKSIKVSVVGTTISLSDYDTIAPTPKVILSQVDINKGNMQVAHGIDAVLLPSQVLKPADSMTTMAMEGSKSLAAVLTAKKSFDSNPNNFDIVTAAVLAVLKAKPNSPVKVLTEGNVALTAFIPTDGAFENLVKALTGKKPASEAATFKTVAGLGINTVEQILEYHVVPGKAILSGDALKANGAVLKTALPGKTIKVSVMGTTIKLGDYNKKLPTPKVILSLVDINKGNMQVAHGIDAVLMPIK